MARYTIRDRHRHRSSSMHRVPCWQDGSRCRIRGEMYESAICPVYFMVFMPCSADLQRISYILCCYFVSNSRSIFGFMIPYGAENLVIDVYLIQSQPLSDHTSVTKRQMYWRWSVRLLIPFFLDPAVTDLLLFASYTLCLENLVTTSANPTVQPWRTSILTVPASSAACVITLCSARPNQLEKANLRSQHTSTSIHPSIIRIPNSFPPPPPNMHPKTRQSAKDKNTPFPSLSKLQIRHQGR